MKLLALCFLGLFFAFTTAHAAEDIQSKMNLVYTCHAVDTCFPGQPESVVVSVVHQKKSVNVQALPAEKEFAFFGSLAMPSTENLIRFEETNGEWRREFEMQASMKPYGPEEKGYAMFGGVTYVCERTER